MIPKLNEKYLITTDQWFHAPDGNAYRSVFGTVTGVHSAKETLGIETNKQSTNWYVTICNMILPGCQIHYCIKTDSVSFNPGKCEQIHEGKLVKGEKWEVSRIYNADSDAT